MSNLFHVPARLMHRDRVLASSVRVAGTPIARARGVIGRPGLRPGEALVIEPCKQVHSFFVRAPIDVVFCDAGGRVLHVVSPLVPWRISKVVGRAARAIEMPAGAARGVRVGDPLEVVDLAV